MTRSEYRRECLARSAAFRASVLAFHARWPPVFVVAGYGRPGRLLKWLLEHVERQGEAFLGKPKALEDLDGLLGFAAQAAAGRAGYRRLAVEDGAEYFVALGRGTEADWRKEFEELQARWPDIPPAVLRHPHVERFSPRPMVVAPNSWLPAGVTVLIPVYADTTDGERDVAWAAAMEARARLAGTPKNPSRLRPHSFQRRLEVWDAYETHRNFERVAQVLGLPRTTVVSIYMAARQDIEGIRPSGTSKVRRAADINPAELSSVWRDCQTCSRAERDEDFCQKHGPSIRAYVDQDTRALRESLGSGREVTN
jgi:hypothetical protein